MQSLSLRPRQGRRTPLARRLLALSIALALLVPVAAAGAQGAQQEKEAEESELRRNAIKMGAQDLVAPKQLTTELPEYTPEAKEAGVQGDVYIEAVVTKAGTVAEPKLIRGLPDDELNRRALEAIKEWTFEPGTQDDEPVDVIALFTVTFRIH